jgi:hypothetical protein
MAYDDAPRAHIVDGVAIQSSSDVSANTELTRLKHNHAHAAGLGLLRLDRLVQLPLRGIEHKWLQRTRLGTNPQSQFTEGWEVAV